MHSKTIVKLNHIPKDNKQAKQKEKDNETRNKEKWKLN